LVIGGFLARAGKTEIKLKLIIDAIAHAVVDEEWGDRRTAIKDAAEAFRNGKTAYGFPALAELVGRDIADKVAEWLDYQGECEGEFQADDVNNTPSLGEWDAGDDIEKPPPRGWLLGNIFARCFISSLIAEGGTGKTALRYAQLLSLATGISLTGDRVFQRCRVLIVSLEDDANELRRRILAARLHYKIGLSGVKGWLFLAAPRAAVGKLMTLDKKGRTLRGALADILEATIIARNIDAVSLDPFVKTHSVEENSNSAIDDVVQVLADLATKYNIAVDIPHHTSKGLADPGNAGRGRGASAMKDGGRLIYTLATMTPEEAEAFGVAEDVRRLYVRMDSAKVNIAPPMARAQWFRLVGIPLDNATELYPNGDTVQTVEPWTPPELWKDLSVALLNRILTAIDAGLPDGRRYTEAPNAKECAAWQVVMEHAHENAHEKTEAQAREIIKTWIKNKVLVRHTYDNPVTRKPASGLRLDPQKRPS
jgi:AAA domain